MLFTLGGCFKDSCNSTQTYIRYTPVYKTMDEVRDMTKATEPQALEDPGKIVAYGNYLFLNEKGAGIHVIDIKDKSMPISKAFIAVPGNIDMAIKGSYLYADNFIDLAIFDISDISNIRLAGREQNVFPDNLSAHEEAGYGMVDRNQGVAIDWIEEEVEVDCNYWGKDVLLETRSSGDNFQPTQYSKGEGGSSSGQAGSMARFAIMSNYLYVLHNSSMKLFSLENPSQAQYYNQVEIDWNIETLFPYYRGSEQYLFVGASNGMYIMNNNNPTSPKRVSKFLHVNSCDPVVAEDTLAFVTLRSGNSCQGFTDELQLIDIKDIYHPQLLSTHAMHNPHGLGIDDGLLFLCDAEAGLKVYDLRNGIGQVDENLIAHITGMNAYDVIPYHGILVLSSNLGFQLIDYTNPDDIRIVGQILKMPN